MPKRPANPPKPITWNIYKLTAKAAWMGAVEAPDEASAIDKAAAEYKGGPRS